MLLRLIVMVLIAVALLSTASCMFDPNTSCEGVLETPQGKLAVVAVIILAAGQNLICGLVIAILFVMFTNNDYREGLSGKGTSDDALVTLDKTDLLKQPALRTAYNKMFCNPGWSTAGGGVSAELAAKRRKLMTSMTGEMTMEFPHGPCNPCSGAKNDCRYKITKGGDQLQAAQDMLPASTRGSQ